MICPDGSMITRTGTGGWRESRNASAPDWSSVYVEPRRSVLARDSLLHAVTPANTNTNSRPIARRFTGAFHSVSCRMPERPNRSVRCAGARRQELMLSRYIHSQADESVHSVPKPAATRSHVLALFSDPGGGSSVGRAPGLQPGGRGFESHPLHYP